MSIDKLALDTVGRLDQYVGIIPSLSAFNVIQKQDATSLKYFVSCLRRFVTIEKIFFGKNSQKNMVKICSNKTAEYHLFGQTMMSETDDELQELLNALKQEKFIADLDKTRSGCFEVKIHPEIPNFDLLNDLMSSFSSPSFDLDPDLFSETTAHSKQVNDMIEKMRSSITLLQALQNKILIDDLNKQLSQTGCNFKNKLNIPMVGSLKGYPDTPVVYILSYFESEQKFSELSEVNFQMKFMLEFLLKNSEIKNQIKEIGYLGGIIDNCFTRKLVTISETDKNMCVLYCIVFKSDLFLNASNDFMVSLKNDIEKNLKWNVSFNVGEYMIVPLN